MKWLTILLALYVFGLSLWPCADDAIPLKEMTQQNVVSPVNKTDSAHEHLDLCTPFCTCACCAATVIAVPQFTYALMSALEIAPIDRALFSYVSHLWADPLASIWQPPQRTV